MASLWAGVGRAEITPAPGTPQGGWGAQVHQRGIGADMPFYATALAISDGRQAAVIVDADAIGFDAEWTSKILEAISSQTKIPRDCIRFSCSHTHSGPNTFRLASISEGLEMVMSYLESLPQLIAGAALRASSSLKRVRVAAGAGTCRINVNRRYRTPEGVRVSGFNWDGPVDPSVRVVRFDDLDEYPLAVLVHYSCHPTIMAWQNQWFTPDFPGVTRKVVEQQLGCTCLFLQGAAGDIGPIEGYTGDVRKYRRAGSILGLEAAKIAVTLSTVPRNQRFVGVLQSGAPIALYDEEIAGTEPPIFRVAKKMVSMPLRELRPILELQAEADELRADLNRLRESGTKEQIRSATARFTQATWRAELARQYSGRESADWEVQCIQVGSIALISTAGEPFTETAQKVINSSPFEHTLFSGYSNGGFGYIPTETTFQEGGYEVEASPFAPDAADVLAEECVTLLKEVARSNKVAITAAN